MKIVWPIFLLAGLTAGLGLSCKSEYQRMKDRELARGIRKDSLFLGIYLGMTSQEFYDHCFQLNRNKQIVEGPNNTTAQYTVEGFKNPTRMLFYPEFYEDRIFEMPMTFHCFNWSLWNTSTSSDSLLPEVKRLMESWYGNGFIEVKSPSGERGWVKIEGNRRILIRKYEDGNVLVRITDLIVEEAARREKPYIEPQYGKSSEQTGGG